MTEDKIVFSQPIKQFVKSIAETDDEIIIPVIGIPFGSPMPNGKDLHNEFFDKSTDVGNLKEAMVYFNHNQFYPASDNPDELEKAAMLARAFKGEILGIARKGETTEDGIIYNIVLDKRKKYSRVLKQMVEDNLLDVSSGAKYRELDTQTEGLISKWHLVEVSFTPTPANPNAVALTKSLMIEALEETQMPDEKQEELAVVDETLVPDSVKSAFAELTPIVEEDKTSQLVATELSELKSQIEELKAQNAELTTLVKSIQATLPYMVTELGKMFRSEAQKSTFEVNAEKSVKVNTAPKPATAPNKRPATVGTIMKAPGR